MNKSQNWTGNFFRLFHRHKILLLALLGPFTDRNGTDFPNLSCTSTIEILNPFIHLKSGKGNPFAIRTKLPHRSHYRGYPSGSMLALLAKSETISLPWSTQHATKLIIILRWMSKFIHDAVSIKHRLRTEDHGLRTWYKIRTRYKMRTPDWV